MQIEIKKENIIKKLIVTAANKIEDIYIYVILFLARTIKIKSLQRYSDRLTNRRIRKLQHQIIKDKWELDALNRAITDIQQNTNKEESTTN